MTVAMPAKPTDSPSPHPPCAGPGTVRLLHLPVRKLAVWKLGAGAGAAVLAGLLAAAAAPGFDMAAVALGTLVVVLCTGLTMGLIAAADRQGRTVFNWSMLIMGGSMGRMLVSLALAMGVYFAAEPAAGPYFAAFLVGSLVVLAAETVIVRRALLATPSQSDQTEPA